MLSNKQKLNAGFGFAILAFSLTIMMSQSCGFQEMNPIMRHVLNNYNNYHIILFYGFSWAAIFALFEYGKNHISQYYMNYIAYMILFIGFFDFLNDMIIIITNF